MEEKLLIQDAVATDAAAVTVNGGQNYIRNFRVGDTVVYHAMDGKSTEALKGLDFLSRYAGILVHDHETALYHFGTDHAECNVHIIRYLRRNTEETGNAWPGEMTSLLCGMNKRRKELMEQGADAMPAGVVAGYEEKYFLILEQGRGETKAPRINMRSRMKRRCLAGWKSTATTICCSCMIFPSRLMITYQKGI